MNSFDIDLGAPFYWAYLGIAIVILIPLTRSGARRVAVAAIDVGFIALVATPLGAVAAIVYAIALYSLARVARHSDARAAPRWLALSVGAAIIVVLFLTHKIGLRSAATASLPFALRLLSAVGYSYVALRSIELLRAGADDALASTNAIDAIAYLFPFHMLAAGPIQAWTDFTGAQTPAPRLDSSATLDAADRIVRGLFKKFVLARLIELVLLTKFSAPWRYQIFEIQVYYLWVYLDFSAYSDLAVGVGRLLGVATPENFDRPFGAQNIIVFWERWHMSLSSFIRRNVFVPLQLTMVRRSQGAHSLAIASVALGTSFVLIGLWHDVSIRFVLWGAMHATAVVICNLYRRKAIPALVRSGRGGFLDSRSYKVAATIMTFEFVAMSLAFIVHPATAFLE